MTKKILWLPGWGMLPELCPEYDFEGMPLQAALPWPGYVENTQNSLSEAWSTEALIQWLDHQVEYSASHGEPVELAGWSMGGLLALCYVDRFPEKVSHLSLWASTACFVEDEHWPGQSQQAVERLYEGLSHQDSRVFERFLKSQIPPTPEFRDIRRRWLAQMSEYPDWMALKVSLDWLIHTDIRDRLPHIHVPITVHHGTEDAIIPFEAGESLVKQLPNAVWRSHPGKGHALWL